MNQDTQDFLATLLFCSHTDETPMDQYSVYDFSPAFIDSTSRFILGFYAFLEEHDFDFSRLHDLQRSFGGNCYASLSGHGIGFFDEYGDKEKTLGDELQAMIQEYSGDKYRFEFIDLMEDENGKLDLAFLLQYRDEQRQKLFTV